MACMKLGSKPDAFHQQGQAWFCTIGLPSDVIVEVEEMTFHLHKVLHNIAVAGYFRDGCTDPRNLLDALNKVKEQSEELEHTFVDQIDSENSCLDYMVSRSKTNSASIHQSVAINSSRVVHAQEFDVLVTMLNIAIILYHIHEYTQSLSVLKKLFQNIEPIEEQIALRVCLLLLDVALACEDILQVSFTNLKYSRVEIDEVWFEWAECMLDYI